MEATGFCCHSVDLLRVPAATAESTSSRSAAYYSRSSSFSLVRAAAPLADNTVWAGFPSVNQANPSLVAFAGQFIGNSNYYNHDINYALVTDRSRLPPVVLLDDMAPADPGFLQQFQARAGWWSPDGKWFAFESNRSCDQIDGLNYAIFTQPADGAQAMRVMSRDWNANHPKWFPPGSTGGKVMLIAAIAEPAQSPASLPGTISPPST